MDNRGVILLNKDFSMEWLPIFKECGINKVGLHSLYRYGGMDGHLNWLLREETQRAIAAFEETASRSNTNCMPSIGFCRALCLKYIPNGSE